MADIGLVDANNPVLNQLDDAASRIGVDRNLLHTVAQMESSYNPRAVSPAGAQGVMQLMPATAKSYGVTDPFDPAQNINGAAQFLRDLSKKYNGDNRLVLAAYNAGEPAVDRAGGVPNFKETKNYVNNGMAILGTAAKSNGGAPDIGLEDAPPAPSTLDEAKRLGSIAAGASGLTAVKDTLAGGAKAAMDFLTGNPVNPQDVQQFKSGAGSILGGIAGEPGRMREELAKSMDAMGRGDVNEAANHLWYSIPVAGAAGAGMAEYLQRGDIKGALAHAAGSLGPVAAGPVAGAAKGVIEAAPEAVSRAAEATGAGLKAAAPDLAAGTAKVGVGVGAHYLPIPAEVKYGVGIPTVGAGARQIGRGIKQGVAAARASLAETALPEAAAAAEAPAAEAAAPAATPVTAPTDEALVHLYSVETDPAKRAALQAQLVDRGLMNQPAAAAPETNPYRGYSQDALQKVYAIEPDAAKRTLIEQTARDRNLTLLNREGRRATAAVPETGFTEAPGPSLTQDDALMLHYLGETDPASASVETIGIARKLAADNPELLNRLRAGEATTEPIASPPTPADQPQTAQPRTAPPEPQAPTVTPAPAPRGARKPRPSAAAAAPPAAPQPQSLADLMRTAPPTPGQAYAASQGYDWAKLPAETRQLFEHIATAQENVATTPAPPAAAPAAQQAQSLGDLMRGEQAAGAVQLETQLADSVAAAKAGKQPPSEMQPAAAAPENIYVKNARLAKAVRVADAAQEAGLTSTDVFKMKPADFAKRVNEASISPDTMAMVVDKLRRREANAGK